jgi:hypothetical protein
MEPKEKAKELIKKFSPLVTTWDCYWDAPRNEDDVIVDAKQCAIIAVEFAREFITGDLSERFDKTMYLLEVKEEIEKL